jgi:hypothetical protein
MFRSFEIEERLPENKIHFIHRNEFKSRSYFEKYQLTLGYIRDMPSKYLIKSEHFFPLVHKNEKEEESFNLTEFYTIEGVPLRKFLNDRWVRQERMSSEEITHLVYNLVQCCAEMQEHKMFAGYINPDAIFVKLKGKDRFTFSLFVLDPKVIFSKKMYLEILRNKRGLYWPPEMLTKMFSDSDRVSSQDIVKGEVFNLGLTILEAGLGFYVRSPSLIHTESHMIINSFLSTFKLLFKDNLLLTSTLEAMLNFDVHQRPDFIKIRKNLPDYNKICAYLKKIPLSGVMESRADCLSKLTPSFKSNDSNFHRSMPKSFSPNLSRQNHESWRKSSNAKESRTAYKVNEFKYQEYGSQFSSIISPIKEQMDNVEFESNIELNFSFSVQNIHQNKNYQPENRISLITKSKADISENIRSINATLKANSSQKPLFSKQGETESSPKKVQSNFIRSNIMQFKKTNENDNSATPSKKSSYSKMSKVNRPPAIKPELRVNKSSKPKLPCKEASPNHDKNASKGRIPKGKTASTSTKKIVVEGGVMEH